MEKLFLHASDLKLPESGLSAPQLGLLVFFVLDEVKKFFQSLASPSSFPRSVEWWQTKSHMEVGHEHRCQEDGALPVVPLQLGPGPPSARSPPRTAS
jgi:hypothetical protein